MSAEVLSSIAGILLSLLFAYVPKVKGWFDGLEKPSKGLVMLGSLAAVSGGVYALACLQWFNVPVSCDKGGLEQLVAAFIAALVANQSTYLVAVKPGQDKAKIEEWLIR